MSTGCQGKLFLEGWGCFSVGSCAEEISSGMGNSNCWPPTPVPLSPLLQSYSSHPGSKGVLQQPLTLLFVLLLFRERLDMGMCGARAPQEQDFMPKPLGNAREGGIHVSCRGLWSRSPISPLLCEGISLMSVLSHPTNPCPAALEGAEGPHVANCSQVEPRMDKNHFSWV